MRFRLVIAYDGTAYHGWQCQEGLPTIAGTLEQSFKRVFHRSIKLLGTSRTDAGVHACQQVATFDHDSFVALPLLRKAWNNALPSDIHITAIESVEDSFDLFDVKHKTYWYHFFLERPHPYLSRFGWYYPKRVDLKKLEDALVLFTGTHDFRAFTSADEQRLNTVRTIDRIQSSYYAPWNGYRIEVQGPKFLHHMIRRIVGASLDIASCNSISVDYIQEVLAHRIPSSRLTNAPAKGLTLYNVVFNHNPLKECSDEKKILFLA